ncbi:MAG: metalloregulator ArsR/SmtB family transcription factor [Chloroflexi bacterium]|nr:metalloregulator ArsR/SmtB family transcription factor [Chloroflexota bacterium]
MKEMDCVSFCRALGDETRQDILQLLQTRGEMRVNDIVAAFGRSSQPTISHHLKVLKQESLVTSRRAGKEILYALNQNNVEECCGMLWAKFAEGKAGLSSPANRLAEHGPNARS